MIPGSGLSALIIILPLALATWRGWAAHRLLLVATLSLAVVALAAYLMTQTLVLRSPTEGTFHDTYYVVAHGPRILGTALMFALPIPLLWAAQRYARPIAPRVLIASVWGLVIGTLGPSLLQLFLLSPPRRYVEYEAWAHNISVLTLSGAVISTLALCLLVSIPLYALALRRAPRSGAE
ncbi:hypothetical protein [uncultured Tateyamaria sp.]|uniref:hypothetical protein n=1 Tax=uncultured Tateyamaria sp. TaxID=455651 RepID=UPI0026147676|nr:hypothetical protein [uncultured Tateyamaria sp.]